MHSVSLVLDQHWCVFFFFLVDFLFELFLYFFFLHYFVIRSQFGVLFPLCERLCFCCCTTSQLTDDEQKINGKYEMRKR